MQFDATRSDLTVGVIGAGAMGRGIAQVAAAGSMQVLITANHFLTLYLGLELMSLALYALVALQRIRAHLVDPGLLLLDMFVPAESELRLGAPLVEVRTVRLEDGSQIALRSESTAFADARMVRTEYRYAHRRGAARLAEEHERITLTWHTPDEISALLAEAGWRNVTTGASPQDGRDGTVFSVTARA